MSRDPPSIGLRLVLDHGPAKIFQRQFEPVRYVSDEIERDVRAITNVRDLVTFRRFLSLWRVAMVKFSTSRP